MAGMVGTKVGFCVGVAAGVTTAVGFWDESVAAGETEVCKSLVGWALTVAVGAGVGTAVGSDVQGVGATVGVGVASGVDGAELPASTRTQPSEQRNCTA